jgi:uncharacterized C2H2 Zn-finger protein
MILRDDDWVCPLCGKVLSSLTEFSRHVRSEHKETEQKRK